MQKSRTDTLPTEGGECSQMRQGQVSGDQGHSRSKSPSQTPARSLGITDNYTEQSSQKTHAIRSPSPDLQSNPKPIITDDMQVAAATLFSLGDAGQAAAVTLDKVLQNLVKNPCEAKYRQLKRRGSAEDEVKIL